MEEHNMESDLLLNYEPTGGTTGNPDEAYLLAGIQLFGQFLDVVFFIGCPQSRGADAVMDRCYLHTEYMENQHITWCGSDMCATGIWEQTYAVVDVRPPPHECVVGGKS